MDNITSEFKNLVQSETKEFCFILDIMIHSKKDVGRRFLNLMNKILDYYLNSTRINMGINLQIIHIPVCESWARELFLRFLIHKIALYHNKTTIDRFKYKSTKVINCSDNKETKRLLDRNKYFRAILKSFDDAQLVKSNNSSNLIIVKESDLKSTKEDKNPWLLEYAESINKISECQFNLFIDSEIDTYKLKSKLEESQFSLENIFIFHTRNKITRSYSKTQLERLNKFNANIKNCFVFSFSEQPFIIEKIKTSVKNRLVSIYNQIAVVRYNDFDSFVTFTKNESDYIFNRKNTTQTLLVDLPEREFFSDEIEIFIDRIIPNLKFRNQLCLCFNEKLQNEISQKILAFTNDFKPEMCSGFFNILSNSWSKIIIPGIKNFISNRSKVAFVVDKDTSINTKKLMVELFQETNTQFDFYSFDNLKNKKGETLISADRLVVFQYRSPNGMFSSYPNILDQLALNKGQKALVVINKLTHFCFYEWDKYWYKKTLNELLYSNFRNDILYWKFQKITRPQSENIKNLLDEDDVENRHNYQIEKCKVHFKGAIRSKEIPLYENVIFCHNGKTSIGELRSIIELTDIEIQQLDEITDIVKTLISKRIEENNNAEIIVRKDAKFDLSENEITSKAELWKILLKKRVILKSPSIVYNEIFNRNAERISMYAFNQWYNLDSTLILPRSNKDKKAILEYLGFEPSHVYRKIINKKKMSSINGSRKMNSLIVNFLKDYLYSENNENTFAQCKSVYFDLLELIDSNTLKDFEALKQMILQEIDLKPVDSFEYD